ncbi:MAG: hypothetical protein JXQ65_15835 [Candidatus Marinimicrobia bacterium]|nr:hypothetical protein [Candidatus Neomarinimicrobiota bacterium]
MSDGKVYDEIKLTDYYSETCGLFKCAEEIDPEYDYTYMISIDSEIMDADLQRMTKVLAELCQKYDIDGKIEGLYFDPEDGVLLDNPEILFDLDDEETAIEFAEEFLRTIRL